MTPAQIRALRGDLIASDAAKLCVHDGAQVIAQSTIEKWECGQRKPSAVYLMAYVEFMRGATLKKYIHKKMSANFDLQLSRQADENGFYHLKSQPQKS